MQLIVNGEPGQFPDGITAAELIEQLGLGSRRLALEVNREIVPKSAFGDYRLQPEDRVEIVQAIGGG
jgi:sulfur carrier protein